jgi:transposase-like protein
MHPVNEASHETGVHRNTVGEVYHILRDTVTAYMQKITGNRQIGGPGKIVCIDETHISKKKRNRGGFVGRWTRGNQTVFMGGVELDGPLRGRKQTGKAFLVIIENKRESTFREVIEKHVLPGSTIWTDGHASYGWLDNDPRFTHETVIHRRGEFSRVNAAGTTVSSNAIEGMFSRVKRLLKRVYATPKKAKGYALFMGEFLWRQRFVQAKLDDDTWRRYAFFQTLKAIRNVYTPVSHEHAWVPSTDDCDNFGWLRETYSLPKTKNLRGGARGPRPRAANPVPPGPVPIGDQNLEEAEFLVDLENILLEPLTSDVEIDSDAESAIPLHDNPVAPPVAAAVPQPAAPRRRRRDEGIAAHIESFGEPLPRRRRIEVVARPPLPEPPRDDVNWQNYTPHCVIDGTRCCARLWGNGSGAQCASRPGNGIWFCARHAGPLPHGAIYETIPLIKLREFNAVHGRLVG